MSDLLEDEGGAPYPPHVQEVLEALEAERDALAARVAAVEAERDEYLEPGHPEPPYDVDCAACVADEINAALASQSTPAAEGGA